MADLFFESLDLRRIDLIARLVTQGVCVGDDRELALVWIAELTDELLHQLDERDQEEKCLQDGGNVSGSRRGLQ